MQEEKEATQKADAERRERSAPALASASGQTHGLLLRPEAAKFEAECSTALQKQQVGYSSFDSLFCMGVNLVSSLRQGSLPSKAIMSTMLTGLIPLSGPAKLLALNHCKLE